MLVLKVRRDLKETEALMAHQDQQEEPVSLVQLDHRDRRVQPEIEVSLVLQANLESQDLLEVQVKLETQGRLDRLEDPETPVRRDREAFEDLPASSVYLEIPAHPDRLARQDPLEIQVTLVPQAPQAIQARQDRAANKDPQGSLVLPDKRVQ